MHDMIGSQGGKTQGSSAAGEAVCCKDWKDDCCWKYKKYMHVVMIIIVLIVKTGIMVILTLERDQKEMVQDPVTALNLQITTNGIHLQTKEGLTVLL